MLAVEASNANVVAIGRFSGVLEPGGDLRFSIRPLTVWDYDAFDFMERLSDGNRLIVGGVVVARGTHSGDHEKTARHPARVGCVHPSEQL